MIGFKPLNGTKEKIPEIGIGTWKMGVNPEKEEAAIKIAIKTGMHFIDTAEMYATEWIVSKAIKNQDKIFVATKASPSHFSYKDLTNACNESLRNLDTKRIDLYQLHWPNHSIPIKETMRAMEDLVDQGKIKHIGVSNFNVDELVEAQNAMKKYDIVSNQVEYSILVRDIEKELLEYCNNNKITTIAYSPLATGAIYSPKYKNVLDTLTAIGKEHDKTPTQVALNWLISKEGVVAIPKASTKDHTIENAGASGWHITQSEMAELDALKERKAALAGFFSPVIKSHGIWSDVAQSLNERKSKNQRKDKTTRSSKK
jgi:diketogulonate reductase-like aldo/keto reductase